MSVHLDHRISYDIDIFVRSSDVIADLTPSRNPATKRLLAGRRFDYPGNYLKLRLDEGEIDFIVASLRTRSLPYTKWDFEGRAVRLESPWETVTKKVFYRASKFKVRDVFDMAAVVAAQSDRLAESLAEVADKIPLLSDRVRLMAPFYEELAANDINPAEHGKRFMTAAAPESVLDFLETHAPAPNEEDANDPPTS